MRWGSMLAPLARGRPVREHLTPCLCDHGPRQAADVRIILGTHPGAPAT
jgi:hypothetical protein